MVRGLPGAMRRSVQVVALAAALFTPLSERTTLAAQTSGTPLITIPPARVPSRPDSGGAAAIRAAPRDVLPIQITVLRDPPGDGLAMYGALTGPAASAVGVIRAIFLYSEAFDAPPTLRLALGDKDDRHAQALFTATVRGAPVIGIAVVGLTAAGGGDATVLYDDTDAFSDSFERLRQALAETADLEIGRSDNSAAEADMVGAADVDPAWGPVIAATAAAEQGQPDGSLAQSLAVTLSSATGAPWRVVTPIELR